MLNFVQPEMADIKWIKPLLEKSQRQGCEFSFGNLFIWSESYGTSVTEVDGSMVARTVTPSGDVYYSVPVGGASIADIVPVIKQDAEAFSKPLVINGLVESDIQKLCEDMPGCFEFTYDRDNSDYVYLVDDLARLEGRKYHSKRNHISFFENNFNWKYEQIDKNNIEQCRRMNERWLAQNIDRNTQDLKKENSAIQKAFDNYFELGFLGGLLKIDGEVVAYTMGEKLNDDTFCTHIEKAFADIRGAYPMINKLFAQNTISSFKYVNREEDLGQEGLRRAKTSYKPAFLVEKSVAVYKK